MAELATKEDALKTAKNHAELKDELKMVDDTETGVGCSLQGECRDGSEEQIKSEARPLDDAGQPLCLSALWGEQCQWEKKGNKVCRYSHMVPEALRAEYRARKDALHEKAGRLSAERSLQLKQPPERPVPQPDWVEEARSECTLPYNTSRHLLRDSVRLLLECSEKELLEDLHKRPDLQGQKPPLCPTLLHAFRLAGRKLPPAWTRLMGKERNRKHLRALFNSEVYKHWLKVYDDFVQAVILPSVSDTHGIYYQRPPTLRIAMPGRIATIDVHCDADYHGHHPAEINFWVPLVQVSDSNTLWLESSPMKDDFRPVTLSYGELLRFNGNLCRHHTVPNTSDTTRVSFDLRVIPASAVSGTPPDCVGDYSVAFVC